MLWTRLKGATAVAEAPAYIGSVTKSGDPQTVGDWDSAGEALDVLSVAQTGDLVVIAFTFRSNGDPGFTWAGMSFTAVLDATDAVNPGAYVGYRFVEAGDANPYVTGLSTTRWDDLSVVASVFRGITTYRNGSSSSGVSGLPNPPSVTNFDPPRALRVITGHVDDDLVTDFGAPANYTLADSAASGIAGSASSTVVAYRFVDTTNDNPDAFTGTGSDEWRATHLLFG